MTDRSDKNRRVKDLNPSYRKVNVEVMLKLYSLV